VLRLPFGADVSVIFNYLGNAKVGALRFEDSNSGARVVYLAFGFEGIDNAEDRATLMRRALSWLHPWTSVDDFTDTRVDSVWEIAPM